MKKGFKGKKGLQLRKNKKFFGGFIALFVLIILINATLAWTSYTEWIKNHTQSDPEQVTVRITEEFDPGSVLDFVPENEEGTQKSVKVKNVSSRSAIIRVRFKESLLPFEMDMTDGEGQGNANLLTVKKASGDSLINVDDLSTWVAGNLLETTQTSGGDTLYYKATAPVIKDNIYIGEASRATGPEGLRFFSWTFNTALTTAPQIGVSTPYWVYNASDNYFYYSQVLEGGQTTAIDLLQMVQLAEMIVPNKYKNALYMITVDAEGVTPAKASLDTWTTDAAYLAMYREDSRFKN